MKTGVKGELVLYRDREWVISGTHATTEGTYATIRPVGGRKEVAVNAPLAELTPADEDMFK